MHHVAEYTIVFIETVATHVTDELQQAVGSI